MESGFAELSYILGIHDWFGVFDVLGNKARRYRRTANAADALLNTEHVTRREAFEIASDMLEDDADEKAGRQSPKFSDNECTVCQEYKDPTDLTRVACDHTYCSDCLQELVRSSMINESLFPPSCCQQVIIPESFKTYLVPELLRQYEQKKNEYETTDRTYCSSPRCSTFIGKDNITGSQATCPTCDLSTCTLCKAADHTGDCPTDASMQPILDAATENGWQRCYSCRRFVELDTGCKHMTSCVCGAQFCYTCGDAWKTCECAQWNEDRLVAREGEILEDCPVQYLPRPIEVQIASATANYLQRHGCDHGRWSKVRGAHLCEKCYETSASHVLECQHCYFQACEDCSRNMA